jgi:hypothetical protein
MKSEYIVNGNIWDKVFIRNQNVVSRKIAGELFLVPVKGKLAHMEQIFALTSVAEYIWDRLDGQRNLHDIRDDVIGQFNVGQEQVDPDIQEFVMELMEAELIHTESA